MLRTGLHVALLPKDSQQSQELVRGANMRSKSALDSVGAESKFRYYSTYITLYCSVILCVQVLGGRPPGDWVRAGAFLCT